MPLRVPQEPLPLTAAEVPALAPAAGALVLLPPVPPAELAATDPALLVVLVMPASGRELMPADVVPSLTAGGDFGPRDAALVPPVGPGLIMFAEVPALAAGLPGLAPPGAAPLEPHAAVVTTNKFATRNSDVDRIVLTARG
jgi:hypothetical protein